MKRIYMTMGLIATMAFGASAQTDLALTAIFPINNQSFPNVAPGDSIVFGAVLTNLGPDNLDPTDSVRFAVNTSWCSTVSATLYRMYIADSLNCKTAGLSDTLAFRFIQGALLGTLPDGTPVNVSLPVDATATDIRFSTYGFTAALNVLDDPGSAVDTAGEFITSGNNVLTVTGVTFGTVGIAKVKKDMNLNVYPNPANDKINFSYNFNASSDASVKISDVTGRVIMAQDFGKVGMGKQDFNVNVSALTSGVYFMEFTTANGVSTSKFTKK